MAQAEAAFIKFDQILGGNDKLRDRIRSSWPDPDRREDVIAGARVMFVSDALSGKLSKKIAGCDAEKAVLRRCWRSAYDQGIDPPRVCLVKGKQSRVYEHSLTDDSVSWEVEREAAKAATAATSESSLDRLEDLMGKMIPPLRQTVEKMLVLNSFTAAKAATGYSKNLSRDLRKFGDKQRGRRAFQPRSAPAVASVPVLVPAPAKVETDGKGQLLLFSPDQIQTRPVSPARSRRAARPAQDIQQQYLLPLEAGLPEHGGPEVAESEPATPGRGRGGWLPRSRSAWSGRRSSSRITRRGAAKGRERPGCGNATGEMRAVGGGS